jgi:hypothetical protein
MCREFETGTARFSTRFSKRARRRFDPFAEPHFGESKTAEPRRPMLRFISRKAHRTDLSRREITTDQG